MTGIEFVLGAFGVMVLMSVAAVVTAVLVVRSLVRRFRRSSAVGPLRLRSSLSLGPQRGVLRLRRRLAESLDSGQAAVALAAGAAGPRGELPRLFGRIREESRVLDLQLQLLESEFDSAVLQRELPAAQRRVEQVEDLVRQMRSAVASALSGSTDDVLADLDAEVEREVAALHAGIRQLQDLNRADHHATRAPAWRPPVSQTATARTKGSRP